MFMKNNSAEAVCSKSQFFMKYRSWKVKNNSALT